MKKILLCALFTFHFPLCVHAERGAFDLDRWYRLLNEIQTKAVAEKINAKTIDAVIQKAVFFPDALYRDKNQAEFKMTMDGYLDRVVNAVRVKNGLAKKREYPTLLRRTNDKYGVPPHVILAFWGLESNYGVFKATHKLSDAFLTLIYDGRRETFFTNQLIALMKIADAGKINVEDLKGSWAGAMGQFQFIPTTWEMYAVDGNGDGKINIINNVSDAFASAGNYLNKLGWDPETRIVREVTVPHDFDISVCDAKTKKTLAAWTNLGVTNPDGTAIPTASMTAGIVCDMNKTDDVVDKKIVNDKPIANDGIPFAGEGKAGGRGSGEDTLPQIAVPRIRAFLTYDNFYRIKKWNSSNYYAIAIALMADELK